MEILFVAGFVADVIFTWLKFRWTSERIVDNRSLSNPRVINGSILDKNDSKN